MNNIGNLNMLKTQWKNKFIERFGNEDKNCNYILNIVELSYLNICRIKMGEKYIKIDGNHIYKLWHLNKHKYQRFISNMMGDAFGLYNFKAIKSNFSEEWSQKEEIVNHLNLYGYYLVNKKLRIEKCRNIKNAVLDKEFKPFDSKRLIKGKEIIDKQLVIDNVSTFWIANQKDIYSIPEVKGLASDPFLLHIVQSYLGCKPILSQTNLWYSCKGSGVERTQLFHQDYDDVNFLKVFIYLSNVTKETGPHRYISSSIDNIIEPPGYKPSTRLSNDYAKRVYKDNIKTFTGEIGTIIIENTNGFHAGTSVLNGNRLLLQLLYSSTTLPLQQGCQFCKFIEDIV